MATAQQNSDRSVYRAAEDVAQGWECGHGGLWRGLKAPALFHGKDSEWKEWSTKLRTYMITRDSEGGKYLKCAEASVEKVDNTAIGERFANEELDDERVLKFSNELHLQLQSCASEEAFRLVISVEEGSSFSLEAWRMLCDRYQPRTLGSKRTILRAVLNSSLAKDLMHVDSALMHVEDHCRRYEELASHPLSEDVKASVIMNICPKHLKDHLELMNREENYQRVRAEIVPYTQSHRSQSQEQLVAMDIGAVTLQTQGEWDQWNEWSNDCVNSWFHNWNPDYPRGV